MGGGWVRGGVPVNEGVKAGEDEYDMARLMERARQPCEDACCGDCEDCLSESPCCNHEED